MTNAVTTAALNEHRRHIGLCYRFADGRQIGTAAFHVHLAEADAVIGKAAGHLATLTGKGLQRIVDITGDGQHGLSGGHAAKHGAADGMGAVDKGGTHQCLFTTEHIRVNGLQLFTAHIIIAVTGSTGKAGIADTMPGKGIQHALGIYPGHIFNALYALFDFFLCSLGQFPFCRGKSAHI